MSFQSEEWRWVAGYRDYYVVSSLGRVKSVDRVDTLGRRWPERMLRPDISKGYKRVILHKDGDGGTRFQFHRLVAEAFFGPPPPGMICCHNDGSRQNNTVQNLRWATHASNMEDRDRHGRTLRGSKSANAVLCELDAWLIKHCDATPRQMAGFFGITPENVFSIRRGITWKHVA